MVLAGARYGRSRPLLGLRLGRVVDVLAGEGVEAPVVPRAAERLRGLLDRLRPLGVHGRVADQPRLGAGGDAERGDHGAERDRGAELVRTGHGSSLSVVDLPCRTERGGTPAADTRGR